MWNVHGEHLAMRVSHTLFTISLIFTSWNLNQLSSYAVRFPHAKLPLNIALYKCARTHTHKTFRVSLIYHDWIFKHFDENNFFFQIYKNVCVVQLQMVVIHFIYIFFGIFCSRWKRVLLFLSYILLEYWDSMIPIECENEHVIFAFIINIIFQF